MIRFAALILSAAAVARAQPAEPAQPGEAAEIFDRKCDFCHGEDGRGQTKKGKKLKAPDFTSPKFQKETTDKEILSAIEDGVLKKKMPAFKTKLTADQIQLLAAYVRGFAGKGAKQ